MDEWLDAGAVARHLGVGLTTVYRLVARGALPGTGRPLRVRRSDLDDLMRRSRIGPGELTSAPRSRRQGIDGGR